MSEEERTKVFQPTVYDTRTGQLDDLLTEKLEHAFDQETQAICSTIFLRSPVSMIQLT